VVVVGDVNSTAACALVAKKLCLPLAHLEAGLRSRDRTMPEEINRLVTDAISDLLWTPSEDADDNLRHEGVPEEKIVRGGNIMIEGRERVGGRRGRERGVEEPALDGGGWGVGPLPRPANVDNEAVLARIVAELCAVAARLPLVFVIHPRTRKQLQSFGLFDRM